MHFFDDDRFSVLNFATGALLRDCSHDVVLVRLEDFNGTLVGWTLTSLHFFNRDVFSKNLNY